VELTDRPAVLERAHQVEHRRERVVAVHRPRGEPLRDALDDSLGPWMVGDPLFDVRVAGDVRRDRGLCDPEVTRDLLLGEPPRSEFAGEHDPERGENVLHHDLARQAQRHATRFEDGRHKSSARTPPASAPRPRVR